MNNITKTATVSIKHTDFSESERLNHNESKHKVYIQLKLVKAQHWLKIGPYQASPRPHCEVTLKCPLSWNQKSRTQYPGILPFLLVKCYGFESFQQIRTRNLEAFPLPVLKLFVVLDWKVCYMYTPVHSQRSEDTLCFQHEKCIV